MSAPLSLVVPPPAVTFTAVARTYAPLEHPLTLSFPDVRFSDGRAVTREDVVGAQALVSRTLTEGGAAEVWDGKTKTWRAAAGLDLIRLIGVPLTPPPIGNAPWEGVLIGAGQSDAAGGAQIKTATARFPQYRVRGAFRARLGNHEAVGVGPESPPIQFASAAVVPLLVPAPSLSFQTIASTYATLEGPLAVSFAAVRFPNGSAMAADDFVTAQAILTRTRAPGSPADVWDAETKAWLPASAADLARLTGIPLLPPKPGATAWDGVFIGTEKDAAGAPQVEAAAPHFPDYRFRGVFRAIRETVEAFGIGPESAPIEFASLVAAPRFAAALTPEPAVATRVRIMLRNAAADTVGLLEIDASGGNAEVTLANFDAGGAALAAVTLQADGSIRLAPLTGRRVIVTGDFEADHIRYLPDGSVVGQPKNDLH
jgi:hypothetical protein